MSEAVIQIRNLSKIYRDFWGRKKVQALNSLSLDVNKGEIFGLLGPNGSGKTTTMKLLLGLLFPTDGEISILGKPASDVSKNERIGYLPEESYLYRFLNAEETLDFYGRLFDISPAERRERTNALIEQVGLQHARRRQLKEYSKGMTRRIGQPGNRRAARLDAALARNERAAPFQAVRRSDVRAERCVSARRACGRLYDRA